MLHTHFKRWGVAAVGLLLTALLAGASAWNDKSAVAQERADPGVLLLLVPDGTAPDHPLVQAWQDAALEVGVRLAPITDAMFLRRGARNLAYAGLVLPDALHTVASDAVVAAVHDYVGAGGRALLAFDFGVLRTDAAGAPVYAVPRSRLSELAGVDYALHNELRGATTARGPVVAMRSTLRQLQVPPGKSIAYEGNASFGGIGLPPPQQGDAPHTYSGYLSGMLDYTGFVTRGNYAGTPLAVSPRFGLVAGVQRYRAGEVLFVNLPLGYLKGRTDALPMHGFLGYFVHRMLQSASLSPMPDGVPGLMLNWHLDSSTAQEPSLALEKLGVFDAGPFSIHMTAGPDTIQPGDGRGWNLDHNPVAQDLLRRLKAKGHDMGNHGGWIHDYYGLRATEENRKSFLPYLELNRESVERIVGPSRSYSAPLGNNPMWSMDWLDRRGVRAVYSLGHTGLGPTRQYRDGMLRNPRMVMIPVTSLGLYATFEEFQSRGVPPDEVRAWYRELVDFCRDNDTARMVYLHPPGAARWPDVVQDLLSHVAAQGPRLRWYSMDQLAQALLQRVDVRWGQEVDAQGLVRFEAVHTHGLKGLVWRLPKSRYQRPVITGGGSVEDGGSHWLVRAPPDKTLRFQAQLSALPMRHPGNG